MKKIFFILFFLTMISSRAFSQDAPLLWVEDLKEQIKKSPVANPPVSITRCLYQAETVYHVSAQGPDMMSVLYSEEGERLCSPEEQGDTYCSKFYLEKQNCEMLWQDERGSDPQEK